MLEYIFFIIYMSHKVKVRQGLFFGIIPCE